MHTISPDPAHRLIRIGLSGMLTLDEVTAFARAEQAAARTMAQDGHPFDLVVEIHGNDFQTQAVMQAFETMLRASSLKARRIAFVRTGTAPRMQTRRLAKVRDGLQVFDDVAAATAWLDLSSRAAA